MSTSKLGGDRNQKALAELATRQGNDICADCKARNPRWASHNLGIFICMNCASIHRKIGTHITKVKSLTMDVWSNDQLDVMKNMGNVKSNRIFNPNEARHPPPVNIEDGTRDSEMEKFIRAKYEYRKFMDKSALVASKLGPSRSSTSIVSSSNCRSVSSPLANSTSTARASTLPQSSTTSAVSANSSLSSAPLTSSSPVPQSRSTPSTASKFAPQARSVSQPVVAPQNPAPQAQPAPPKGGVWNDLLQLQDTPGTSSSLPLQYQQQPQLAMTSSPLTASFTPSFVQNGGLTTPGASIAMQPTGMGFNLFQQQQQAQFTPALSTSSPFTPSFQVSQPQAPQTAAGSFGQQLFMNNTGLMSQPQQPGVAPFFHQPQPQSASLAPQQQNGSGFLTPSPSIAMHSAPPTQTQFNLMSTPSPNGQFHPQGLSHSPGPQMQMNGNGGMGMTGMYGQGMTPSPQPMGMMNGQFGQGMQQQHTVQSQFGGFAGQQPQQNAGDQFLSGLMGGGGPKGNNPFGQQLQQPQQQQFW